MQQKLLKAIALVCVVVLGFATQIQAQQVRTVTGTVYSEDNTTLPGANIRVKGTTIGTITDVNGKFSLQVPATATILEVSYIGKVTQEIEIGTSPLKITLSESSTSLSEVVVIGYGTVRRNEVTSAIASVSQKELKNLQVTGADQALQGKVAGVTITNNSGQPGGGVSMRVRGLTSINSNDPLIVIDGVPFTSNTVSSLGYDILGGGRGQTGNSFLANINPNDIETIDVLKDASAQAIYGSQAANGVIMITTKKGKAADGRITYDGSYGISQITNRLDLMNLSQYAEYQNGICAEQGLTPSAEFANPAVLGEGTNWQEAIFRTGYTKNHALSFSGANAKTTYYASLGYLDQTGTIEGSDFERFTTRFNIDHQVKSWLNFGMSSNILRSTTNIALADNAPSGTIWLAAIQNPLIPIYNLDGTWGGGITLNGNQYTQDNPVANSQSRGNEVIQTRVFGNVYAEIKFLKDFSLKNEVSYDLNNRANKAYQLAVDIGPRELQSKLIDNRSDGYYYAIRNYLNYNKNIGKHFISATAGHEAQQSYWQGIQGTKLDLSNNILDLDAGSSEKTGWELSGGKGVWAMESYFARVNYMFDNRYSLSASYRADGSANFGPDSKWGYFPGVSVGWTVSNENFAKKISNVVSYLKLRAGYGGVGNQNLPNGAPFPPYSTTVPLWTGPVGFGTSTRLNGIPNGALSWEKVITTNGGIDVGFIKNRIELSLDLYKKTTSGMLMYAQGATFLGIGSAWDALKAPIGNVGQMTNKGIDINLTTHNFVKKDFTWNTILIFSSYKNNVDKLLNETFSITGSVYYAGYNVTYTAPGHPIGSFYGLEYDGIIRTQAELDASYPQFGYSKDQTHTWLGDVRYKDINGDEVIDEKDMTYIGSPIPDFTFGFTNNLTYKDFDLSIFLQGSYGAEIFNFLRWQLEKMDNTTNNQLTTVLDRYTAENTDGSLPRFTTTNSNNTYISSRYIEDGSYIRIQNLTLGYRLPQNISEKVKMTNLRLYVSAQNLYTFTKYTGYDPEIGSYDNANLLMNVDQGHYPNPRVVTFGVNVEF